MLLHVDFVLLAHLTLFFGHQFASVAHTSSVINFFTFKKSLKIPKGYPEAVNRRRTD